MDAVVAVAEEAGRTPAPVALRRLLGRPGVAPRSSGPVPSSS
ncbi:hypothetical protein ACIA8E_03805 [Streptomyces sp. NPDC051664]